VVTVLPIPYGHFVSPKAGMFSLTKKCSGNKAKVEKLIILLPLYEGGVLAFCKP
jgi:hypothetical protein